MEGENKSKHALGMKSGQDNVLQHHILRPSNFFFCRDVKQRHGGAAGAMSGACIRPHEIRLSFIPRGNIHAHHRMT